MSGSIETMPTQPTRAVAEVHVAVAAAGDAVLAAHVLAEDPRRASTPRMRCAREVAVQDAEAVLRGHRARRAGGHGLLAEAVVEASRAPCPGGTAFIARSSMPRMSSM